MNKTSIEYLTHTWNPTHGCDPISEGCRECWAKAMAKRLAGMGKRGYSKEDPFKPVFCPWKLEEPLHVKKPAIIGDSFMGDLFSAGILWSEIDQIMDIIWKTPQHTHVILTKRPHKAWAYFDTITRDIPRNMWLGVSVESDKYRWRVEELIKIPVAHRLISYEPALGPLDLFVPYGQGVGDLLIDSIDGVIAGCESGHKRRPSKVQWFRDSRDQCVGAGVPFFLKQMDESMDKKAPIIKMPFLDGKIWNELPF